MIVIGVFLLVFISGFLLFGRKKQNPYIKTHKAKWKNERDYLEYIEWLDKSGGDLPINEIKFKEDREVLNEVSKNFKP